MGPSNSVMSPRNMRAQAAFEYLMTYGWVIIIVTIAVLLIYSYVIAPNILPPSVCYFVSGVKCNDVNGVINSTSSLGSIVVSISNLNRYAVAYPHMFANVNGTNTTPSSCSSAFLKPGNTTLCTVNLYVPVSNGTSLAGKLYISVRDCGLLVSFNDTPAGCAAAPEAVFSGDFSLRYG